MTANEAASKMETLMEQVEEKHAALKAKFAKVQEAISSSTIKLKIKKPE